MRFGLVHRIMTDALAALGVLAVVSTASVGLWTNVVLLSGLVIALLLPEPWQSRPTMRHFATVAPLALFVIEGARLLIGRPPLDVAVEFAALLQIVRLATRRGAAHDQQIIVLALLHFVAGTVLGGGLTYGICFVGFLIVAPGALVLSHLRREVEGNYRQGARDRTGLPVDVPRILRSRRVVGRGFLLATCLLSVPILLFTAALFVLFPRVGLSLMVFNHPRSGRMVGFSDHVDLGEVGVLRTDTSIALRFQIDLPEPPPRLTLRLRGTAFDAYDGRAWYRTQSDRRPADKIPGGEETYPILRLPNPARDRKVQFDLEPIDPAVIFLPPRSVGMHIVPQNPALLGDPMTIQRGPEGEMRYVGSDTRGLRYDVYLAQDREIFVDPMTPTDRARYLKIPERLPTRIGDLAHEWTDNVQGPEQKARILEDRLRHDFRYDLGSPSGGTPQPLDHFLFESKRGHCEFFSTAMAVMLRHLNIPSRNVTGFVGGTYNRFGRYYAVREGDAHSWVEAYIDDPNYPRWVTFDPTPPAGAQPVEQTGLRASIRDVIEAMSQKWNTYVIHYDLRTQVRLFDEVSKRYNRARKQAGVDRGPMGKLTRGPVVVASLLVIAFAGYVLWRRRRWTKKSTTDPTTTRPNPKLETTAALYRSLELALAFHGVSRPAFLPPLRHAEMLSESAHPLADEVIALTQMYLEVRFGGAPLTPAVRRDFEKRVRQIRAQKPTAAESNASSAPN